MIGQTISHYRIVEKLGGGGMGIVYKAQDTRLKRTVALKFLPPDLTRDEEAKTRFVHEAQAASALQHNNICTLHDIDETADGPQGAEQMFIVMDCYEGETVKKKIERGPLKIEEAIDVAIQIAQGLEEAHKHHIIHRDVKPANVLVTTGGVVKIVDFGLAKLAGQTVLTKSGSTVGTAAYMSPEQTRGEAVDARTDIWSLGVLLYEMVTGQRPFKGEYDNAVLYSILNVHAEPMTALGTAVPMELERIVQKCLSKEPSDRYQHVDELLVDLRSCRSGTSQVGAQTPRPAVQIRRSKRVFWYGAAAGLIALSLVAYFLAPREERPASHLKMIAVLPFANLGSAGDESFADGLTDEIATRLGSISKLGVISRTSSVQYKKTSKSLPVIAKELGVDYVLEGTIRWDKTGSNQRIRITPRLITAAGDVPLWNDNIDRTLDDIFVVQTEIATKVVKALNIVLSESEKRVIEASPTKNLEAYEAYVRGLSFTRREERPNVKMAIEMFHRAVQLDSTFALAYARLSYSHLSYYWFGYDRSEERLSAGKKALERAFALQGDLPEAYIVLGYYYYWRYHYDQALEAFAAAEQKLPNDSRVLPYVAYIWRRQGKFEAAAARLKKAFELDPQAADIPWVLGATLAQLGIYPDAEVYYERCISLLPDQDRAYRYKAAMYLRWLGDTKKSRSELERVPTQYQPWVDLTWLDIYERNYQSALSCLDHAPVRALEEQGSVTTVSQLRGLVCRFMNDPVRSRVSFDSARVFLETEIKKRPDDHRLHESLGIVYAGLGRAVDAVREAELAVQQLPITLDAIFGIYPLISLAQVYTMVGKYDAALDKLEYLVSLHAPKYITAPILRLDPTYDPLRSNPRFQALLAKAE
ncbi:MAG: protein kinase [Ignavibacteria bacterium]|nr:protein kinase [Ignavibacteria bacterium]